MNITKEEIEKCLYQSWQGKKKHSDETLENVAFLCNEVMRATVEITGVPESDIRSKINNHLPENKSRVPYARALFYNNLNVALRKLKGISIIRIVERNFEVSKLTSSVWVTLSCSIQQDQRQGKPQRIQRDTVRLEKMVRDAFGRRDELVEA